MEAVMKSFLSSEAEAGQWCDVALLCGDRRFAAHRVVLSSVSPFLREALLSCPLDTPTVIVLPDFDPQIMVLLLQYIYHGEVVLGDDDLVEFLNIAKAMQVTIEEPNSSEKDEKYKVNDNKDFKCWSGINGMKSFFADDKIDPKKEKYSESEERVEDLDMLIKSDKISKNKGESSVLCSYLVAPKAANAYEMPEACADQPVKRPGAIAVGNNIVNQSQSATKKNKVIRPIPSLMPIQAMFNMSRLAHYYGESQQGHGLLDLTLRTPRMPDAVAYRPGYYSNAYNSQPPIPIGSDTSAFLRKSTQNECSPDLISRLSRKTTNKVLASPWSVRSPVCYRREYSFDGPTTTMKDDGPEVSPANSIGTPVRRSSTDNNSSHSAQSMTSEFCNSELKSNDTNNNFAGVGVTNSKIWPIPNNNYNSAVTRLEMRLNGNDHKDEMCKDLNSKKNSDGKNPHSIASLITEAAEDDDACAIKCEVCLKMFTSKSTLAAHMKTHATQARYHCDQCDKSFSQLRNYKYHVSVHKGTKEFAATCNVCGKYFNDRGYLSSHMKIHRNRKEYQCPHCPKSFNQRVAYNMHVRIHTGVKPHQCEACGKAFSRKMLLKQHYRTHSGEKPYACSVCSKRFADRSNMTLHMRLHSGVKPFSCSLCPKSFTKKHHLKTHLNYHTGNKPYACEKCGLTFSQSSNMRTHMKKCNSLALHLGDQGLAGPHLGLLGTVSELPPKKNSDVFNIENLSRSSSIN